MLAAFAAGVADEPAPRVLLSRALRGRRRDRRGAARAPARPTASSWPARARRLVDSVKDLDIIATASDPPALLAALARARRSSRSASAPGEQRGAGARPTRASRVDLRVVEPDQFGNLLQHFTGSKAHNMALREAAVRRGLHVSEYGVLDDATGETHRCATEEEVYALLGLPWIPPELREDRGELRFRAPATLPVLIEQADLRGRPAHAHDRCPTGATRPRRWRCAARELGPRVHRDHRPLGHARLRQPRRRPTSCARQIERDPRARRAPRRHHACSSAPRRTSAPTARPDYDDDLLAELDWVDRLRPHVVRHRDRRDDRAHGRRDRAPARSTRSATRPGARSSARAPYALDMDAHHRGGRAHRDDDRDQLGARPPRPQRRPRARRGARPACGSSSTPTRTAPNTLSNTRWGVATARRAWLTAADVANTLPWEEFAPLRKRAR